MDPLPQVKPAVTTPDTRHPLTCPPHRRHAERIANVWLQRVKESPPNKKLVLIYLANGQSPHGSALPSLCASS
jgi:hypothetical protein